MSSKQRHSNFSLSLEEHMKNLWAQYIRCLDKNGLNEGAKELQRRYFELYRQYRQNKEWEKLIQFNKEGGHR